MGATSLPLPAGDYRIELSYDGYVMQERTATVVAERAVSRVAELGLVSDEAPAETIEISGSVDTREDSPVLRSPLRP